MVLHLQYTTALLVGDKAVAFLLEMLRQIVENKGYIPNLAHSLFCTFPFGNAAPIDTYNWEKMLRENAQV